MRFAVRMMGWGVGNILRVILKMPKGEKIKKWRKKIMAKFDFRLKQMENKNAAVLETPNGFVLFSYETAVAKVAGGKLYVCKATTYSKTTAKHIREFVDEYAPMEFYGKRASELVKEAKAGKNDKLVYEEAI